MMMMIIIIIQFFIINVLSQQPYIQLQGKRGTYEKIHEISKHKYKHTNNNNAKIGNVKRDSKQTNRKKNQDKSKT